MQRHRKAFHNKHLWRGHLAEHAHLDFAFADAISALTLCKLFNACAPPYDGSDFRKVASMRNPCNTVPWSLDAYMERPSIWTRDTQHLLGP
eukprot:4407042-Prymnesium_polylepis.1